MDSIGEIKRTLRKQYRMDRSQRYIPESWLHILQAKEMQNSAVIASYLSYEYEPETKDLNKAILASGKKLVLPRLLPDNDLEWVEWDGSEETLVNSLAKKNKIMEPVGRAITSESVIDAVIVPALHIDREGNRLGQGGGSYDRALRRVNAWKVGLVGNGELTSEAIPHEPHDQKVDAAATPNLILRFSSTQSTSLNC